MSDSIKPGDLVMVTRPSPCCGNILDTGYAFTPSAVAHGMGECINCGKVTGEMGALDPERGWYYLHRLIKIDPPAKGDTLPTRADLDKPVKEVV